MEEVILVDEKDNHVGICEKIEAHKKALRHRAISVIIFNSNKEMLIQRRAFEKYHCPGLWSNVCCTHPRDGESNVNSAIRRLEEEMGIKCDLDEIFCFNYIKKFDNGLTENEVDHTFWGKYDGKVKINIKEVSEYKWISINQLLEEIKNKPDEFTFWFKLIVSRLSNLSNFQRLF